MIDGFDSPVGTPLERAGAKVWPGKWIDVNCYGTRYDLGFHTGADLNLPSDLDAHSPVYAVAEGRVIFSNRVTGNWGNLIVIKHSTPEGPVFSRYGHVEEMAVRAGETVSRGQQICKVGNAYGKWAFHLHFDMSNHPTRLQAEPADWSASTLEQMKAIYIDPKQFISTHRPPALQGGLWIVAPAGLNLREAPNGTIIKAIPFGTPVITGEIQTTNDIVWVKAQTATGDRGWIAARQGANLYLSNIQPKEG